MQILSTTGGHTYHIVIIAFSELIYGVFIFLLGLSLENCQVVTKVYLRAVPVN